jgi:hypothetical protein
LYFMQASGVPNTTSAYSKSVSTWTYWTVIGDLVTGACWAYRDV